MLFQDCQYSMGVGPGAGCAEFSFADAEGRSKKLQRDSLAFHLFRPKLKPSTIGISLMALQVQSIA